MFFQMTSILNFRDSNFHLIMTHSSETKHLSPVENDNNPMVNVLWAEQVRT